MLNSNYTLKAVILSAIYWLIESVVHGLFYTEGEFELIPSDINELSMRIIIVLLLIFFGRYADQHTKAMLYKEWEKRSIFNATINSTQHILNNLLSQMRLFKKKVEDSNALDAEAVKQYEYSIKEGQELVDKLASIKELTEENIDASANPKIVK